MSKLDQDLFMKCVRANDVSSAQQMLRDARILSVNIPTLDDLSAVSWAVKENHVAMLSFLLDKGGTVRKSDLEYAVRHDFDDLVKVFLRNGIKFNDNILGPRPHIWAKDHGAKKVAALLKKEFMERVNQNVRDAVVDCDVEKTRLYLDEGADIETRFSNDRTYYNATLVNYAATKGHADIVELLISRGADIHALDIDKDDALASAAGNSKNYRVIEMLMEAGANPLSLNKNGHNAYSRIGKDDLLLHELLSRVVPVYGPDEIGFQRKLGNRYLEEIFNFSVQERTSLLRRHKNGAVETMTRDKFIDIESSVLSDAFNKYKEAGGSLDKNRAMRSASLVPVTRITRKAGS